MKRLNTVLLTIGFTALVSTPQVRAQSFNNPGMTNPVEVYTCNWVEGKGIADLLEVAEKYRRWAEKYNPDYAAWILTPNYHGPEMEFDVAWVGSWPDYRQFASAQTNWRQSGAGLAAEISAVVDCNGQHQLLTSTLIDAPEGPPDTGVALVGHCSLAPGKTTKDALDAHLQAGAAMRELGSKQRSWIYTPGLGAGNEGYDYWRLYAFSNYVELGDMLQAYTSGGGKQRTDAFFEGVVTCDSPGVFDVQWAKKGAWYTGSGEN